MNYDWYSYRLIIDKRRTPFRINLKVTDIPRYLLCYTPYNVETFMRITFLLSTTFVTYSVPSGKTRGHYVCEGYNSTALFGCLGSNSQQGLEQSSIETHLGTSYP